MAKKTKPKNTRRRFEENPPDALGYRRLPDGPKRSPIMPIGEVLPSLLVRYGVGRQLSARRFRQSWATIFSELFPFSDTPISDTGLSDTGLSPGTKLSPDTARSPEVLSRVAGLRGGTLTVEVHDAALLQELTFYTANAVRRFQELLPEEKIRKVKFVLK